MNTKLAYDDVFGMLNQITFGGYCELCDSTLGKLAFELILKY